MKRIFLILLLAGSVAACSGSDKNTTSSGAVAAPSTIAISRTGATEVKIGWADNSTNESGFAIWVRDASNIDVSTKVAEVAANVTEYTLSTGLVEGTSYYFGVQALASNAENSSRIIYELYNLAPYGSLPTATFVGSATATATCLSVSYRINAAGQSDARYGLCWSADATPTVADAVQYGPTLPAAGDAVLQVIPNALLEYGKTYKIRAFVTVSGDTYYSSEISAALATAPAAITLNWTKKTNSSLPFEIEFYETTDQLSGHNFHAWYAVGDLSTGNVELRVQVPSAAATIDAQASTAGDCYVLVNGGYFYNGNHTGLAVVNSTAKGSISAVRGSLISTDAEYNVMYNVTRGLFGVDAAGKPAVYWAGTTAAGAACYFDRPLPSVKGEAKYGAVSSANPTTSVEWSPKWALSAGPLLLWNGVCPFDFTTTASGSDYYLSNYELMPYDIFGTSVTPDRTAVGYRADGKVVLFICDGRITASGGATLTELAAIMKGLGCVGAVNFDGGGSTGMVVGGEHLNDQTGGNRAVVSTIGFFRKK